MSSRLSLGWYSFLRKKHSLFRHLHIFDSHQGTATHILRSKPQYPLICDKVLNYYGNHGLQHLVLILNYPAKLILNH